MKIFILLPLIALSVSVAIARDGAHDQAQINARTTTTSSLLCDYQIIVRTGDVAYAGTDAIISLELAGADGTMLSIKDLASWGNNGPGYNYFERGNTDKFIYTANCMNPKPCKMLLESDNSGNNPGWYVDYIKVIQLRTFFTPVSHMFKVNQWLAKDESPYQLNAYRDDCSLLLGVTAMA
ncbi:unnamed protein product [Urochloa decumbens]|uniref:PLAT domain-containing protein n=1 Tax=Urochloa decumbens TaxID=240449 RepID=A0ABC9DWX0_9POAL